MKINNQRSHWLISCSFCLITALILYILTSYYNQTIEWLSLYLHLSYYQMGPFIYDSLSMMIISLFIIGIFIMSQLTKKPIFYGSIIFHLLGAMFMIVHYQRFLGTATNSDFDGFSSIIFIYIGMMALTGLFSTLHSHYKNKQVSF